MLWPSTTCKLPASPRIKSWRTSCALASVSMTNDEGRMPQRDLFQAFGVWRLAFGVWRLAFGVWRLAFGICHLHRFFFPAGGGDAEGLHLSIEIAALDAERV